MQITPSFGYSAEVSIELRLHGEVHDVAQIAADSIVLRQALPQAPAPADLVITVDGNPTIRRIQLETWLSDTEIKFCRI